MKEPQARFIRKLRIDQNCPLPTVARMFYDRYGDTSYFTKKDAKSVMYFDEDQPEESVKFHSFSDGPVPAENIRVTGYVFSEKEGSSLCSKAMEVLEESPADGWAETDREVVGE
jgi:hypothetical protein